MIIIQIGLTAIAFSRGWKWRALLPMGIAIILGYFFGFFVGLSGGDIALAMAIGASIDFIFTGVLIYMIACPPEESKEY